MKRIKFIYNPISGSGNSAKILDTVIATYQKYNKIIVPFRIGETFPLEIALEDIHDNYEHLLIAGGDGTVNRVLNLYMKKELTLPIAILPTGTANDFAKYLDMPLDIAEACEKILHSKAKQVDLGKVNDVYFINVFSFGLFTDVSQKTPTHLKNTFGKLAYYFNGMKEIPRFGKIDLKVESEDLTIQTKCFLAFVFNGQTAGNINIAYNSKINDGLLDVILVKGENLLKLGNLAYNFLRGEHLEKVEQENILYFKSKSLSLSSSQEITTDIDGETGPSLPVQIKCIPKAIPILY
ncbi:YegS/Rv2252/BmrU family lipid kinase [Fusobacterium necrophorum]|uniref:YegS/Rv2252/BmrU family lipid kinase n=1 Tax=Fusobacterium necrophorum TaxID=859 RepID=UPI002551504D|nr:YegS/Rv2252/BmrU family lipid kinase [Fusobacterium necrophorum]MDK4513454.1 YegS/Rv2252/BmrU family lipid kinase [Fusobacterium necrophorum]MDK4519778.1 YegS/Rv2252/BmrU family lipid kinase [Fusobacterium necrophorum]